MGRRLEYFGNFISRRDSYKVTVRKYLCKSCVDCRLAKDCLIGKSKQRCVTHDGFEPARQKVIKRMRSTERKEIYGARKWLCETPFAVIKGYLKIRRFLLPGLEKVRTEWLWICTSYNLSKLVREIVRMRVRFSTLLA